VSTWVHAWLVLHKISKSSLLHVYHGNNVGHPLYPRTTGQTLTYIMSSCSTSLEPKSQLTINLDPGWECQSLPSEESKKERKFPIKRVGESKKGKKIPDQGSEGNKRNMQKGLWTRQYLNNTELSPSKQEKKGNHDLKWSSPFDCQPKFCALVTCSPHTKQKKKRKRPRTLKAKIPTKKQTIPKKKSYWSMITHVIFDLIGKWFAKSSHDISMVQN